MPLTSQAENSPSSALLPLGKRAFPKAGKFGLWSDNCTTILLALPKNMLRMVKYDADLPEGIRNGINHEMELLEKFAPVEYAITRRYLLRYIPENATVADVGAGAGHYSELLA